VAITILCARSESIPTNGDAGLLGSTGRRRMDGHNDDDGKHKRIWPLYGLNVMAVQLRINYIIHFFAIKNGRTFERKLIVMKKQCEKLASWVLGMDGWRRRAWGNN
jgi:hypothetical protein